MYVIEDSDGLFHPADRCTFVTAYDTDIGSYRISASPTPRFYDGATANGTAIGTPATLGYLGKSGRFVPMTRN